MYESRDPGGEAISDGKRQYVHPLKAYLISS